MATKSSLRLDVIEIPKPCPADWDDMRGDERVRFCKHCSLNVYNLSAMTRDDAERMVAEAEGKLCVRFYKRLDGTVITQDCGGGWRLAARRVGRFASAATAVVLSAVLAPLGLARLAGAAPSETCEAPTVAPQPPSQPAIMGDMVMPPPAVAPAPAPAALLGRMMVPRPAAVGQVKLGKPAPDAGEPVPLMGTPAPLPFPPPAPTTAPAPAPATQPVGPTTRMTD
ncbi:MAG TPA: hypothetical protein VER17_07370 [Tepidisphaeraceae bacterium]|nr:hypothetical protein [Tepidisphaeraceae bacterium]